MKMHVYPYFIAALSLDVIMKSALQRYLSSSASHSTKQTDSPYLCIFVSGICPMNATKNVTIHM